MLSSRANASRRPPRTYITLSIITCASATSDISAAGEKPPSAGVGVGKVAGRLPKLGERKRRTQFEAPGGLPPRNGDGGLERLLGDRQVGRVTLQQHFAADAMKFRFEGAMTSPFARRQRLIEDRDRTVDVACVGFGFGNRNLDKPVEVQNVLLAQEVSRDACRRPRR